MSGAPIIYEWSGDAMVPLPRFKARCDKEFAVHETYPMVEHQERSTATHNHYFASVVEAWKNLPEDKAEIYTTPEKLRKWALVRAGYYNERSFACESEDEARRLEAFIRPMDQYAVIVRRGDVVKVFTAQSQSRRHMDKQTFAESKAAVLLVLEDVVGVRPGELSANTGRAA